MEPLILFDGFEFGVQGVHDSDIACTIFEGSPGLLKPTKGRAAAAAPLRPVLVPQMLDCD